MGDYGQWGTVLFFTAIFVVFAFSFTRPKTTRDWRSFGAFSAFMVALFVEMYGLPLTLCLLSGWIQEQFPGVDPITHEAGHLWHTIFGWSGDPHLHPVDMISTVLIIGGLLLLGFSWRVLYRAQKNGTLAHTGPYSVIRHPQYVAFILIMFGYLMTWPTIITLVLFPFMVFMYVKLAHKEEGDAREQFGQEYDDYAERTPGWFPRFTRPRREA